MAKNEEMKQLKEKDKIAKNSDLKNKKDKKNNESYFKGVKRELKLVKWPSAKEVWKYTLSTIVMCVLLCLFFLLLNLGLSFVKGLFV